MGDMRGGRTALAMVVNLLLAFTALMSSQSATAQSSYQCKDASGRTWLQNQRCVTPANDTSVLYKCVTARGAVSIQNAPCPSASKTVWKRGTAPEFESAGTRRRQAAILQQQSADARALSRQAGTDRANEPNFAMRNPTEREQRLANCVAAKRNRETVLAQVGLKRTYALLQGLDETVYRACKGL